MTAGQDNEPTLMTAEEVAALLRLKPATIYEAAARGRLPVVRLFFSLSSGGEGISTLNLPRSERKRCQASSSDARPTPLTSKLRRLSARSCGAR